MTDTITLGTSFQTITCKCGGASDDEHPRA
jgi:hypothetical protein